MEPSNATAVMTDPTVTPAAVPTEGTQDAAKAKSAPKGSKSAARKRKRRRRLKLAVAGVVGLGVLGGGAYAYRWQKIRRHYASLKVDGLAAAAAGGADAKVVELLGPYIQREPSDEPVLVAYAKARIKVPAPENRHVLETIGVLRALLQRYPDTHPDERRTLLELFAKTGYVTETLETADAVLARSKGDKPAQMQAQAFKAKALLRLRRLDEALAAAKEWTELDADDFEADLVALDVLRQQGRQGDELVARVQPRLDQHPGDPRFLALVGTALTMKGDKAGAMAQLKAAAAGQWSDARLGWLLVNQFGRLAAPKESLAVLERMAKLPDAREEVRPVLATRYWEAGRWAEAADYLTALADPPDVAGGSGSAGSTAAAVEATALRAVALSRANKPDEAAALRRQLAGRANDPFARGWSLLIEQVVERASPFAGRSLLDACQKAVAAEPLRPYLYHFMGEAYAEAGEPDAAIRSWRQAGERSATWASPLVRMADMLAATGRYDMAAAVANQAAERGVQTAADSVAYYRVLSACVESGRVTNDPRLLARIEEIQKAAPGEETTLAVKVGVLARAPTPDGRAQAAAALRDALASEVKFSSAGLLKLASISQATKLGTEDACFARFEKDFGLTPALAYARAVSKFAAGDPAAGLKELEAAKAKATSGGAATKPAGADWQVAWAKYLDLTQDPRADAALLALGDARPDDLDAQQIVLRSRSVLKDQAFMARTVERVRALTGDQALGWQTARARWLLQFQRKAGAPEARTLLSAAVQSSRDSFEARVLLAQALEWTGDVPGAIEQLTAATNLDPDATGASLNLSRLLQVSGQFAKANEQMARLAGNRISDPEQRRIAAILYASRGQTQQAVELMEQAAGQGQDALLLAQLYRARNESAKVEETLAKLMANPDAATVAFAADYYAQANRPKEAEAALSTLDRLKLEPGEKELVLADYAAARDQADEAAKRYRSAAAAATGVERKSRAWESLVSVLLAGGQADEAVAEAGRGIDAVRAAVAEAKAAKRNGAADDRAGENESIGDGLKAVVDAKATLTAALKGDPQLRPFAVALVRDAANRPAAAALLQDAVEASGLPTEQRAARVAAIAEKSPQFVPLQALLADRYSQLGRLDEAAAVADKLVQASPGSVDAVRLQAAVLLRAKRWAEALQSANRWRELSPAAPLSADLVAADAYLGLGQPEGAIRTLGPHLRRAGAAIATAGDADGGADAAAARQVMQLNSKALAAAGDTKAAMAVVEPLLRKDARWRASWALFVVEGLGEDRAAYWLDQILKIRPADAPPDELIVVGESYSRLGERSGNPAYADRAREILVKLADDPASTPVATLSAGMRMEADKDTRRAEFYYRRVIGNARPEPQFAGAKLVAKNNLAMMLIRTDAGLPEAVKLATEIAEADKTSPELQDTLATVQAKANNLPAALAAADRALALAPDEPRFYVQRAKLLAAAKQFDPSLKVLAQLETKFPGLGRLTPDLRWEVEELRRQLANRPDRASAAP